MTQHIWIKQLLPLNSKSLSLLILLVIKLVERSQLGPEWPPLHYIISSQICPSEAGSRDAHVYVTYSASLLAMVNAMSSNLKLGLLLRVRVCHYPYGCVTLTNSIGTEAVMWLLLSSCVRVTDAFIFFYQSM